MARKKKKHGKATKKARITPGGESEELKNAPHTFVFNRGHVGKNINELIRDTRRVMEPYTASHLKVRRNNVLKDFVSIASMLHVTHFVTFTKTEVSTNMKIIRLPRGPTLTFRVHSYSLAKDVVSSIKKPSMEAKQFLHHPLLVMNNLSGDGMQFKLMASMFQNMFPSINVSKVNLKQIRRCLLINYNADDKTLDMRHYNIKAVPVGMSKGVKKLTKTKIPNMGKYEDFTEYLMRAGEASESEAEQDGPENVVTLPQNLPGQGNIATSKSAIRLTEIGPRMKLQLVKIEEGVCGGEVLFHEFVHKSEEEIAALKTLREKKRILKDKRKQQQEENVKKKQTKHEELKQQSMKGMKKQDGHKEEHPEEKQSDESEEDDDVEYFKDEVGENPDPDLFSGKSRKRKSSSKIRLPYKKKKTTPNKDISKKDYSNKSPKRDLHKSPKKDFHRDNRGQKDKTFNKGQKEKIFKGKKRFSSQGQRGKNFKKQPSKKGQRTKRKRRN